MFHQSLRDTFLDGKRRAEWLPPFRHLFGYIFREIIGVLCLHNFIVVNFHDRFSLSSLAGMLSYSGRSNRAESAEQSILPGVLMRVSDVLVRLFVGAPQQGESWELSVERNNRVVRQPLPLWTFNRNTASYSCSASDRSLATTVSGWNILP